MIGVRREAELKGEVEGEVEVELGFISPAYGAKLINRVGQLRTALDAVLGLVEREVVDHGLTLTTEAQSLLQAAREVYERGTEEESDRATILLQRDEARAELARWVKRMKLLESSLDEIRKIVK